MGDRLKLALLNLMLWWMTQPGKIQNGWRQLTFPRVSPVTGCG